MHEGVEALVTVACNARAAFDADPYGDFEIVRERFERLVVRGDEGGGPSDRRLCERTPTVWRIFSS